MRKNSNPKKLDLLIYSSGIKHYLHCISDMVYVCTVTPYIAFFLKFEEVFLIVAVKY